MKRIVTLVLVAAMLVSALICGAAVAEEAPYKVAFICRNTADVFAANICEAFNILVERDYSDKITLDILDTDADNEKENTIIETCITNQYDAIIVQPNDNDAQLPYCQTAVEAGLVVVTTNAGIRELEGGYWVDADPYEQGRVIAELALEQVPENGNICFMTCNPGNLHTESRMKAFKEIFLAARPDVTVLAEKCTARADEGEFMATMEDWVSSFDSIDAVLTIGDALARSCYEVVKDNPAYADILLYGVDGDPSNLLLIKEGHITCTVIQDTYDIAGYSLQAAYTALSTGTAENIALPATLVTQDNVDEWLDYYVTIGRLTQEDVDAVRAEA